MTSNRPPERMHGDTGLQPERTILAWGRTMMALVAVSAIFLRWLPHHGLPILALFAVAVSAAAAINLTQRRRYSTRLLWHLAGEGQRRNGRSIVDSLLRSSAGNTRNRGGPHQLGLEVLRVLGCQALTGRSGYSISN